MMHRTILTLFSLFISLLPLTAQEDEQPLAYVMYENNTPVYISATWRDNRHDSRISGQLAGEFGFRQGVSEISSGTVRFGVDFVIGEYALSPDRTRIAFSAYDPANVTASDGHVYRGFDYGLFIYHIPPLGTYADVVDRIDIGHPVDVIWSPEGDALLLRAVGIEGLAEPFYSGEEDTLIYDLTTESFYTLQAGDPPVFYTDGYDAEFDVEGKTFYFSAVPPYIWLPDGRIVFQSGGIDCANECDTWNDLYVAERDGTNVQRLTTLDEATSPLKGVRIEDAVWSPVDERIYIEINTNSSSGRSLYSLDQDGELRAEMLNKGDFVAVHPLVSQGGNYVTVYSADRSWSIQQLAGNPEDVSTIYQSETENTTPVLSLLDAFSPNERFIAVNDGLVTQIINLETGRLQATIETGAVCGLRWVDDQILMYQMGQINPYMLPACPELTNGLWLADISDSDLTSLTERFGQPMRLLLPD